MSTTVIKQLPSTWAVGGQQVTEIELRPPVVDDLFEAENEVNPATNPNRYRAALACRQLVRAGTFTGPFTTGQFRQMKPSVFSAILAAAEEAEKLGEAEPSTQTQPS